MLKKKIKILLADDDVESREFVEDLLHKEGYRVVTASNGYEAVELAKRESPDLIILDVKMPRMDGMEATEELRKIPHFENVLIAFLSSVSEDYLQVAGYNAGADDYIVRPVKPKILLSKIKALLRRSTIKPDVEIGVYEACGFKIYSDEYKIVKDKTEIYLTKKEFDLFALLVSRPGKVFKRADILRSIWRHEVVGARTIDVHILKLREKMGEQYIASVTGVGYRFELPEQV